MRIQCVVVFPGAIGLQFVDCQLRAARIVDLAPIRFPSGILVVDHELHEFRVYSLTTTVCPFRIRNIDFLAGSCGFLDINPRFLSSRIDDLVEEFFAYRL